MRFLRILIMIFSDRVPFSLTKIEMGHLSWKWKRVLRLTFYWEHFSSNWRLSYQPNQTQHSRGLLSVFHGMLTLIFFTFFGWHKRPFPFISWHKRVITSCKERERGITGIINFDKKVKEGRQVYIYKKRLIHKYMQRWH